VSVVNVDADIILAALDESLGELLDRGSAVCDRLKGARTPAEAIAEGAAAAKAWGELAGLVSDYRQIRAAQTSVMVEFVSVAQAAKSPQNTDPRASDLLLFNMNQVCPGWRAPSYDYMGALVWSPPWPQDETEYLVWLCTSDARAWVPTLGQLSVLWSERKPKVVYAEAEPGIMNQYPVRKSA